MVYSLAKLFFDIPLLHYYIKCSTINNFLSSFWRYISFSRYLIQVTSLRISELFCGENLQTFVFLRSYNLGHVAKVFDLPCLQFYYQHNHQLLLVFFYISLLCHYINNCYYKQVPVFLLEKQIFLQVFLGYVYL